MNLNFESGQFSLLLNHNFILFSLSNHVRNAATNALLNSLEFTKANFDKDVSINVKTSREALRLPFRARLFKLSLA